MLAHLMETLNQTLLLVVIVLLLLFLNSCSRIPIGTTGRGYWDQCVKFEATGINSVGEGVLFNIGSVTYSRNQIADCRP
jgi:hypothetical protein